MTRAWPLAAAWWYLSAALVSAPAPTAADRDVLDVVGLTVDAMAEPLGIDNPKPRLAWRLESARRGVLQTDYRVLVASRPEWVREGTADVWDSGNVRSADPSAVYDGRPLKPRTRYYWSVRVATTGARHGGSSSRGWFETALLTPTEWKGAWIAGPERSLVERTPEQGLANDAPIRAAGEFCRPTAWPTVPLMTRVPKDQGECREIRPAPMFRKAFTVGKPVARARVYSSGLGYHDLSVNGARASDSVLDPQFTDYSKTVLYTTADVTALLRPGENVLASELGSGQFDDATRTWDWGWHEAQWRATPRLRLDLHVTYTDGTEEVVASDDSWRVSVDGPRRYDSTYLGETYDARREIAGWKRGRLRRRALGGGARGGRPRRCPARAGARADPRGRGAAAGDADGAVAGRLRLRRRPEPHRLGDDPRARTGGHRRSRSSTARSLENGRASTKGNDLVGGQLQTDYYVARGEGEERWAPRFSYKGFQYVQLSGPGRQPLPEGVSVAGRVRAAGPRGPPAHVDLRVEPRDARPHPPQHGLGDPENNVHGIITDTPVYEKNAWTGDAQLTAGTASMLFDTERLYRKMFQDMRDAQTARGRGAAPGPEQPELRLRRQARLQARRPAAARRPPWDAFWFVIPWESYQRHGDRARARADLSRDAEVPRRVDPALDGQGRRRATRTR